MTGRKENMDFQRTMVSSRIFIDRREYPRVYIDLPLEYRMKYDLHARGAIVIDASETGFLIYSTEDIAIGTKLKITVLFAKEYELAKFEVFVEIIWEKIIVERRGKGYMYGLKVIEILEEDHRRLKRLLSRRFK